MSAESATARALAAAFVLRTALDSPAHPVLAAAVEAEAERLQRQMRGEPDTHGNRPKLTSRA